MSEPRSQSRPRSDGDVMSAELERALARRAVELSAASRAPFAAFAGVLFARLGVAHGRDLSAELLAGVAAKVFGLLDRRQPGVALIDLSRVTIGAGEGRGGAVRGPRREASVIVVINEDKPFLVSSVMGEIQARHIGTQLVLHPVHQARRAPQGAITEVRPLAAADAVKAGGAAATVAPAAPDDWQVESVILVIADPIEEVAGGDLMAALSAILGEVDRAVGDFPAMVARLDQEIAALERRGGESPSGLIAETIAFCRWMRAGQFVFLGMREYHLDGDAETGSLRNIAGSGLGVLANPDVHVLRRGRELVALTDEIRRFYLKPSPIIITKSNATSRVHRRAHMDYVGLKTYDAEGRLAGELRMVGLFTAGAYTDPPDEIPFLRMKVDRIFRDTGIRKATHEGRMLDNILATFPRDELFQIGVAQLAGWVPALLQLEFDPKIRVFVRRDRFDRFVSILAFVPRDRFSTEVRQRIGDMLADIFKGRLVLHQPYFTAGPLVRVHFIVGRYEGATPVVAESEIERRVGEITETWEDRLQGRLMQLPGGVARFSGAFPASYAESFPPERALEDIERIERLAHDGTVAIDFYREADAAAGAVRAAIYRFDAPIPLSDRVPILENLGFRAVDERTYRLTPHLDDAPRRVFLHDMALTSAAPGAVALPADGIALEQAFLAVFNRRADDDLFNRLVAAAGIDWREAAMLRAYAGFMRQIGLPYGRGAVAETLLRHPGRASDLVRLFKARFDPVVAVAGNERARVEAELKQSFIGHLDEVPSLEDDRILRVLVGLIAATQRTNFYMRDAVGAAPRVLAFKIASREVADAPEPRPHREIWVSGPEVDGVHLRFAPIARGGLRWSDRAQDFRTEVLGLAKAQQVKNTVIVPQGAKGGFVPKLLPAGGTREAVMEAGIAAYRTFISALLDLTDNLVDGRIVPPRDVVRHDGDDPYLVVAADKGTATFSDFANALSLERGFWLGDAFASGGSAGYDHKKMGITARGAFEGVKRHFREMDRDILSEPFTVAGVGDMSGDVFGNGMLLSRHTRLVAAFDHRDIFLDPDPDPARSFEERARLFALPRSSWQDYDRSALSAGGGIFSRSAKSIALSPEVRALLALDRPMATPNEVMRAILMAKVDLFWMGGIGTYVRADSESDAEVGDRGNDAIRIPASRFGAKVVGEGANLGLTQRARIDFAGRGGRINTDFIDNSAGVNSSDQEVNIKIALAPAVSSGRLDTHARDALLARMTEDVARACLANNYAQSLALSLAERRGPGGIGDAVALIHHLEGRELLNRALESLPDDAALAERASAGGGLTRPELAILMSYAKIALSYDLIASKVPDDGAVAPKLTDYFPPELQRTHSAEIEAHPLRREIITTALTNDMVNIAGLDLPARLADEWDLEPASVAHALLAALGVLDAGRVFDAIGAEDSRIPGILQLDLYGEMQRQVRDRAWWHAAEMRQMPPLGEAIARQSRAYQALCAEPHDWMSERRRVAHSALIQGWLVRGAPEPIARSLALARSLAEAGDVCLVAEAGAAVLRPGGQSDEEAGPSRNVDDNQIRTAAAAYVEVGDALRLTALKRAGRDIAAGDRFDRLAINAAIAGIAHDHRAMTLAALAGAGGTDGDGAAAVAAWRAAHQAQFARAERRLADLVDSGALTVARLTVAAALVRELASVTTAAPCNVGDRTSRSRDSSPGREAG